MLTTLTSQQMKEAAGAILAAVDNYCATAYDGGHRRHLGASEIGHTCDRHLWYKFRWVKKEKFGGRMQRLFNRGHREEHRFVEWLHGAGITVSQYADEENQTQYCISDVRGHFGGSCDGKASFAGFSLPDFQLPDMLLEFKTNGTGAGFNKLKEMGVKHAKPQHYSQMCTYGKRMNLRYALYMNINKNDDDIHCEIVELDYALADRLTERADRIISAQYPPNGISTNSSYFECCMCPFQKVCHLGEAYEKNCRSCKHSVAAEDKKWFCNLYQNHIPDEFIPTGCANWTENS